MQESPKFLIYKHRDFDAIRVLQYVCDMNGRECGLSLAMLEKLEEDECAAAAELSERETAFVRAQSHTNRLVPLFTRPVMTRYTETPRAASQ